MTNLNSTIIPPRYSTHHLMYEIRKEMCLGSRFYSWCDTSGKRECAAEDSVEQVGIFLICEIRKTDLLRNTIGYYFDTWINGSPRAVDSSAMERRVRFGNPVVHRETTASLLPNFLAKSRWLIFFSLRIESMRAIISADGWTSVRISCDTDETFSLNHSCLFLISQKQHHQRHRRFHFSRFPANVQKV